MMKLKGRMKENVKARIKAVLDELHETDLSDAEFLAEAERQLHIPQWRICEEVAGDPEYFGFGEGETFRMSLKYTRARRENTSLLLAVAGASGSGKTYSAMQLATGICAGEPFAVLDTEARRALHYADAFDFEHVDFEPPFSPRRYLEHVQVLATRQFRAIIIDSASHEWEGVGGVLEMADADKKKPPSNWIGPKAEHKKMVNGLLQAGTNIVVCLRAQEKISVEPDPDKPGKTRIVQLGWQPICEKRLPYEMTCAFTLAPESPGIVNLGLPHKLQDQHRMAFPVGQHIGQEGGRILGAWARGESIETPDKALWDGARRLAADGWAVLKAHISSLTDDERLKLRPISDELKRSAREADENLSGPAWE